MKTTLSVIRLYQVVIILLLTFTASSQSISSKNGKYEIGANLGPSFFLGDIGGNPGKGKTFIKDVNIPFSKLAKGLFFSYFPTEMIGIRVELNKLSLEADDNAIKDKGGDEVFRKQRNLNFRSKLTEAFVALELYPSVLFENYTDLKGKFRPYGIIGVGSFKFNPEGKYIDPTTGKTNWVKLKPLQLEGQGMSEYPDRKEYKLSQLVVPIGAGIKYYMSNNIYMGFEVMYRKTFTDYIDDVSTNYIDPILFDSHLNSGNAQIARQLYFRQNITNPQVSRPSYDEQRGDPRQNDSYFSSILRIGWRINHQVTSRQLECPKFY